MLIKKEMVTIKSAAEILGISTSALRDWDKKGLLKAERNPQNGYRLYRLSDLGKMTDKIKNKRTQIE
ncbi:MAG TPA: MerR family DNA-binding transcriptional regulator [Candidatus Vogelbacteria bacterium]|nr:MerR family DNA-binding transcriptional regulator [Candidatus Vogelbacteria bacterium]